MPQMKSREAYEAYEAYEASYGSSRRHELA